MRDGEGWRGRFLVSTLRGVDSLIVWGCHPDQVADAVIEALDCFPWGLTLTRKVTRLHWNHKTYKVRILYTLKYSL